MHDWKKFRISSEPSEGPKPAIKLPPDHVIGSTAQMQRLARLLIYIDVPRRQVKDWITNTMHGFEGYVVDGRGRDFALDDDALEAAFNEANDKDRKDYRWISDFWKWADRAPRQRAQARVVERLRLIKDDHMFWWRGAVRVLFEVAQQVLDSGVSLIFGLSLGRPVALGGVGGERLG